MVRTIYLAAAALALISTAASAAKRPQTPEAELTAIENFCNRNPDWSKIQNEECLSKSATRLRSELASAVRRKLFEISEVEKANPDEPVLHGAADAARWKAAFLKEQATWAAYMKQRCANTVAFDYYGGSGGGGIARTCELRLTLERLREIGE